jgi:hypothetical protein
MAMPAFRGTGKTKGERGKSPPRLTVRQRRPHGFEGG